MDVLLITSLYPPHSYGGYEATCRDVVDRWRSRGHRVTVLTTTTRVAGVAEPPDETHVRRALDFYWVDHELPDRSLRQRVAVERHNQEALARALAEVRPQVVSAWSMGALSLGLLASTARAALPLVLVVCDDWLVYGERADLWRRPFAGRRRVGRLAEAVTRVPSGWPPRDAAHAVYVSEHVRARAQRDAAWLPATSTVVGSGIDLAAFRPDPPAPRPWSWRLLQVGRTDRRKGLDDGLRALAHLPDSTRMTVLGTGDAAHAAELVALAADVGAAARTTFSSAPRQQLADAYRGSDVLLFLPTWDEPFGLVPLEAMACGTPVVATATGGSAEFLVDGENCLVVPRGDAAAVASAVRRLADDAALRRRLVDAGLATARRHGVDRYAQRLEAEHLRAVSG